VCFLAGEASHRVPPQGLRHDSGIQNVNNCIKLICELRLKAEIAVRTYEF